jgi:hypothetical protein
MEIAFGNVESQVTVDTLLDISHKRSMNIEIKLKQECVCIFVHSVGYQFGSIILRSNHYMRMAFVPMCLMYV